MTEFVTQKGKVIHVAHTAVTVACAWSSETPRKPRYSFSWETGSSPTKGKGSEHRRSASEDSEHTHPEQYDSDTVGRNQSDVEDSDIPELEDYPDEEADRLWWEEYEEQFED